MALVAKQTGEGRKPIPAGNYLGVIVGVYDLGTQDGSQYGPKHQILLQIELHGKKGVRRTEDGKPLIISKFYNLAFSAKAELRKDVEAILNRSFTDQEAKEGYDVFQLIDVGCRLTVQHEKKDDGIRDFIASFSPLDEDDPNLEPETSAVTYELDPGGDFPDGMPEWVRKKIQKSHEWNASGGRRRSSGGNGRQPAKASRGGWNPNADMDDDGPAY